MVSSRISTGLSLVYHRTCDSHRGRERKGRKRKKKGKGKVSLKVSLKPSSVIFSHILLASELWAQWDLGSCTLKWEKGEQERKHKKERDMHSLQVCPPFGLSSAAGQQLLRKSLLLLKSQQSIEMLKEEGPRRMDSLHMPAHMQTHKYTEHTVRTQTHTNMHKHTKIHIITDTCGYIQAHTHRDTQRHRHTQEQHIY